MKVKKRDGAFVPVRLDEITDRITSLIQDLDQRIIDPVKITLDVVEQIYDGIPTSLIDSFTAGICHMKSVEHHHFNILASRLIIGDHQKTVQIVAGLKFSEVCKLLYSNTDQLGEHSPLISDELYSMSQEYKEIIDNMIVNDRDFLLDYFGFKTLAKSYLLRISEKPVETPQHMFMRVALGIHGKFKYPDTVGTNGEVIPGRTLEPDFDLIKETYDLLSQKYFTHATPTLYNAGTRHPQMFSCFEENTLVDTLSGPKPIKNVVVGDEVVTHLGNVKKVVQVHANPVGDRVVYELKIKKTVPLKVTGNHNLWTYGPDGLGWKAVENLTEDDYVSLPNYQGDCVGDNTRKLTTQTGREIIVNEDFCRFLGAWYGKGHVVYEKLPKLPRGTKIPDSDRVPSGIALDIDSGNEELNKFCLEAAKMYGVCPSPNQETKYCKNNMFDGYRVNTVIEDNSIGNLFEQMYYTERKLDSFEAKTIKEDIFKYETPLVVAFIEGLISANGTITKGSYSVLISIPSERLARQVYSLCRLHGFDVSINHSVSFKHSTYSLNVTCMRPYFKRIYKTYPDERKNILITYVDHHHTPCSIIINDTKFLKVCSKRPIKLNSSLVYTLGIEDDHSYSIGGIIAQNCFLEGMDDSLQSIYGTLAKTAQISKWSGGVGIHIHEIRANGSYIRGTSGKGDGIVPMLRVFNDTARYVNQGGRRSGSFAIYLEPWHADIQDFLKLGLKHGDDNRRARDLFYALWIPDLFMERAEKNEMWSLMCPSECPGLANVYGKEFKKLYEKYESEGRIVKSVKAQDLWNEIIKSQIETGTPYMTYKDAVNYKSNQKNIGTIRSSNLCAEIMEYSDSKKYACCVLASMVLPTYCEGDQFNHQKLAQTVKVVVRNLNKLIDMNYYPVEETSISNFSERPIGIGVQGLADVFFKMGLAYDSAESIKLDKEIMETIYFSALQASMELSKKDGPYATFKGSPISKGQFQFDLWKEFPTSKDNPTDIIHSGRYDWEKLRRDIKKHGVRNSLVTALMPTATTSQIMGSASESFEPITSNCYTRRVKAGEFMLINPYMANDLIKEGLWNEEMRQKLIDSRGSIQSLEEIPKKLRDIYKTVWELPQKSLVDHSLARAPYVDQSQSLNLYFPDGDAKKITNAHFYGWKRGLKTGSYYIRSKPAANSASFTLEDPVVSRVISPKGDTSATTTTTTEPSCDSCGA